MKGREQACVSSAFAAIKRGDDLSMSLRESGKVLASAPGLMPPYIVLLDFLDESTVAGLLDYTLSRQADFTLTGVGQKTGLAAINPSVRVSRSLPDLGPFRPVLKAKILGLLPKLVAQLRIRPIEEPHLETELVAHGDGAFYKRHIDTRTANYRDLDRIRLLSGVYYFQTEPKGFTGGALRLYAIGGKEGENFVDIEPTRNSLLVFLSWAPHEVSPVVCPSKQFVDSRFAVNCWVHGRKPGT